MRATPPILAKVPPANTCESEAASANTAAGVELQLIVNNWCRQDCAIASNHAVLLSNASRSGSQAFPLDYCSVYCNAWRLEEFQHDWGNATFDDGGTVEASEARCELVCAHTTTPAKGS